MNRTHAGDRVDLATAFGLTCDIVAREWVCPAQTNRVTAILGRFCGFCESGHGIALVNEVTPAIAEAFIRAATSDAIAPTASLMHFRRNALRLLFRSVRRCGADVGDPTLDLVLPRRAPVGSRPLADDEVTLCRGVSQWSLSDSRRAAAWALAEASARSGELPHVRARDVDLANRRVWLHGGKKTTPRWGILTDWGIPQIARRFGEVATTDDRPLVYEGRDRVKAGQISSCIALFDIFERAGLQHDPGVRPASIAAWVGRGVFEATGRIDEVARRLGMRRLDQAARFIGWSWDEDGPDEG